jgi:hypothetical protein
VTLYLAVGAWAGPLTSSLSPAQAAADNTFRFFLVPVANPFGEFGYTTASGNSYLSASSEVPEPTTILLLGTGLAAVLTRRRVRNSVANCHRRAAISESPA